MGIYLGNLSVAEIEKRSSVKFPQELIDYMTETHQERASDVMEGKWHCFDIPFILVCGDVKTATHIYNYLSTMSKDFSEPLQIALA